MEGIKSEAQQNLIPNALHDALQEKDIDPISVDVEDIVWSETEKLDVKAKIKVMAPFEVDNYKNLEAENTTYTIKDRNIDFYLDQFASRFAERKEQDQDHEIIEKDFVSVTFTPSSQDEPAVKKIIEIGKKQLPELETIVTGMKKDEEKEIKEALFNPENVTEENRDLTGKIKINQIESLVSPQLTDELIEKHTEHKTLEDFRNDIQKNLEKEFERMSTNKLREDLLSQIMESNNIEIPEPIIDRAAEIKSREFMQMLSQKGVSPELFMNLGQEERAGFTQKFKTDAQKELKLQYILKQIAQQEKIEVSEDDISAHIEKMAEQEGRNLEKLKILFSEDSRKIELKKSLLFEKTIQAVIDAGNITLTTIDAPLPNEQKQETEQLDNNESQNDAEQEMSE
jgi:trigger factor